jgi:hypothetical protein
VSLTPRDAPLTGRWDEHAELAAVDPSWPARVQAYEDALRNIAAIVVPAPSAAGDMLTGVESQLAALVALGYTPQPDTTGRRPLTAPESPR